MLDFRELDENFVVRYDESKKGGFAYLYSKDDNSVCKEGTPGLWKGDFGWISVSEAYNHVKEKGYHFYPSGWKKATYIAAYELNETFGHCTDDRISLFFIGQQAGKKIDYVTSIGDVKDTTLELVNLEIKFANYLLGYISSQDIIDLDSASGNKEDILYVLEKTKSKIAQVASLK